MATFEYKGRDYPLETHALAPDTARRRNIINMASRKNKSKYREYHIENIGGIPTLVKGTRVVIEDGQQMIASPGSKRLIKVGGRQYRNLIRAGYTKAPGEGGLIPPEEIRKISLKDILGDRPRTFGEVREALRREVRNHQGKTYITNGERTLNLNTRDIIKTIAEFAEDIDGYRGAIERWSAEEAIPADVFENLELFFPRTDRAEGAFILGADNGFCVRNALMQIAERRGLDENAFANVPDWCSSEDLQGIANSHECTIIIYTEKNLKMNPTHTFKSKSARASGVYRLCKQFNHVVPLPDKLSEFKFADNKPCNIVVYKHPIDLEDELERALANEPVSLQLRAGAINPTKYEYSGHVAGFITKNAIHKLEFDGIELQPTVYSSHGAVVANITDKYPPLNPTSGFSHELAHPGIMYVSRQMNPFENYYELDQIRAYENHKNSPYLLGFPSPDSPHRFVSIEDSEELQKLLENFEGFVVLTPDSTDMCESPFTFGRHAYAFPLVRLALERGVVFTAEYAMVFKRIERDLVSAAYQSIGTDDKRVLHKSIGLMFSHEVPRLEIATSVDDHARFDSDPTLELESSFKVKFNGIAHSCSIYRGETTKKSPKLPYIAAYVHAAQKTLLFDEVLFNLDSLGVSKNDLVRVWVDGVQFTKQPKIPGVGWRLEKKSGLRFVKSDVAQPREIVEDAISIQELIDEDRFGLTLENRLAVIGPPGTGKSHWINTEYPPDTLKLAPTWDAALKVGGETIHRYLARTEHKPETHKIIIIDEISCCSLAMLDKILSQSCAVHVFGDFKQLPAVGCPGVTKEALRERGFVFEELETIHRASDEGTKKFYRKLRDVSSSPEKMKDLIKKSCGLISKRSAVALLKKNATILCATNSRVDEFNSAYADSFGKRKHKFVRYYGGFEAPVAVGMRVASRKNLSDVKNNEQGVVAEVCKCRTKVWVDFPRFPELVCMKIENLSLSAAQTYHRAQGATLESVVLDTEELFETPQLYVGATRVRSLENLKLLR